MENFIEKIKEKKEYHSQLRTLSKGNTEQIEESVQQYKSILDFQKSSDVETIRQFEQDAELSIEECIESLKCGVILSSVISPFCKCYGLISLHHTLTKDIAGSLYAAIDQTKEFFSQDDAVEIEDCLSDSIIDSINEKIDNIDSSDVEKARAASAYIIQQLMLLGSAKTDDPKNKLLAAQKIVSIQLQTILAVYNKIGSLLSDTEREVLDRILDNELINDYVINQDNSSQDRFTLPEDLFQRPLTNDKEQYIGNIKNEIRIPRAISDMINYLASEGFISDDTMVKSSLAYRLTGRELTDINRQKIIWKGSANNLIYICRILYGGKYSRLQLFFDAIDDADKLRQKNQFSSYADRADKNLVENMKIWFNYK